MGMPTFDESVSALRSHLVAHRKPLEMGGVYVTGRQWLASFGLNSRPRPPQASCRCDGARGGRGAKVPAGERPIHEPVPSCEVKPAGSSEADLQVCDLRRFPACLCRCQQRAKSNRRNSDSLSQLTAGFLVPLTQDLTEFAQSQLPELSDYDPRLEERTSRGPIVRDTSGSDGARSPIEGSLNRFDQACSHLTCEALKREACASTGAGAWRWPSAKLPEGSPAAFFEALGSVELVGGQERGRKHNYCGCAESGTAVTEGVASPNPQIWFGPSTKA